MIAYPTIPAVIESTSLGFQPGFTPVSTVDRHACALASIATLSATSLDDVFQKAEALGLPKEGPYYQFLDEEFLARLLAEYGWVASVWKECSKVSELPDLSIALVGYDPDTELGRFVVIHRAKASHDGKSVIYAIDSTVADQTKRVRTDLDALSPAWFMAVHPMRSRAVATQKK